MNEKAWRMDDGNTGAQSSGMLCYAEWEILLSADTRL